MKKVLLSFYFLLSTCYAFSQQSKIDSLLALIKKDKEDTNKINHFNAIGWELKQSNPDTAIILSNNALSLAQKSGWKKGIANSLYYLGVYYHLKGDYPTALDYYLKALKIDEELGNKDGIAKRLGSIGSIYHNQGDYSKALDYYLKYLKIAEHLANKSFQAIALGNIGLVYSDQGDYSKALDYYFRALKIDEELNGKVGIVYRLGNIGSVYYNQANYPKALDYYLKALNLAEELGDKNLIAIWIGNIGSLYTKTKKYAEAEKYLLDALKLEKEIGSMNDERQVEEEITELYTKTNRYQLALEHYKKAMVLKDTLFSEENKKQLVRKEMNYEFEKKEALTKAEQDKKDAITAEESRRERVIRYSVIGGLVMMFIIAVIIFRSLRVTRKQKQIIEVQKTEVEKSKEVIEEQKKLVEEHNKDITDSIHYASRIQRALLTSEEYISKHLNDYFILFKPKDIVSGDFYWAFSPVESSGKHTFYFACCDCTGHGVPGAFMSLLNISFLNEALIEKDLRESNVILNNVRKNIVKALNPDGSIETKDGMDAILCSIDLRSNMLQATCANNPLWIARNGAIDEIVPDKMPVGSHSNMDKSFTKHSVQLQQGDIIYLFTDGFADQFGGPKGKKFKYKQLEEVLLANSTKTMAEQKQSLEKAFEDWKGSLEQVDDVLLIGIRV